MARKPLNGGNFTTPFEAQILEKRSEGERSRKSAGLLAEKRTGESAGTETQSKSQDEKQSACLVDRIRQAVNGSPPSQAVLPLTVQVWPQACLC